jgi:uncharacterized protein
MSGEKDLDRLLKTMKPQHNAGDYVFCVANDLTQFKMSDVLLLFKEHEANTIIIKKEIADSLNLPYTFVAAWITLMVHSSLEAVGLTAAFSTALAANNISCNVVAAFYHDHIFVDKKDIDKAMQVLNELAA